MRIVKGLTVKKLLSLMALAALLLPAAPVAAATANGSVTLQWNISASVSLNLYTDYSSTGVQGTVAPTEYTQANGGAGSCTAPTSAPAAGIVNFGSVVPDLAKQTWCYYKNAVNAQIVTNSTNWNLSEQLAAALPASYQLCASPNGYTFGSAPTTLAATQSSATAAPASGTACPTGETAVSNSAATAMITADATPFASASPANVGEDLMLVVPAGASTGAQTATLNFTAVAN